MTEKRREYNKKWREANKEEIAVKKKAYYKANKEILVAKKKAYYQANKEKIIANEKAYRENILKDGYYTVYYLKEEHYVGMTSSVHTRLQNHKNNHNRHIEDVEIIGKYETKREALRVEAALHSMGYLGRHPQLKQQTLKQVL